MTMHEMRKWNKRLKAGESPEQLAKEIEEKYRNGSIQQHKHCNTCYCYNSSYHVLLLSTLPLLLQFFQPLLLPCDCSGSQCSTGSRAAWYAGSEDCAGAGSALLLQFFQPLLLLLFITLLRTFVKHRSAQLLRQICSWLIWQMGMRVRHSMQLSLGC